MWTNSSFQIRVLILGIGLSSMASSVFAWQAPTTSGPFDLYATEERYTHADEQSNDLSGDNTEAHEPCSIKFHSASNLAFRGAYSRGYSAEHHVSHSERLPFSVKHTGSECDYRITIRPVNGKFDLNSGNDKLDYHLSLDSDGNQQRGRPISLRNSFAEGYGEHHDDLILTIPSRQQITAGIYSSSLSVLVYQLEGSQEILVGSQNIAVSTQVTPYVKAAFESGKTMENLSLGNLATRKEFSLQMNIDANTRYSVFVSSTNKGNLSHTLSNMLIPYSLFIDNEKASLSNDSYKILSGQQKISSESVPVKISYTPGNNILLAGQYEDRIEIRIVAD